MIRRVENRFGIEAVFLLQGIDEHSPGIETVRAADFNGKERLGGIWAGKGVYMAWVQIANTREIAAGEMKQIVVNEESPALFHVEDGFYVTSNLCTHRKQYLTDGSLDGEIVSCPRHGGKFDVKSGAPTAGPCYTPLRTYSVEIRNDEIWIDMTDHPR